MKNLVILGAGFAGFWAAMAARRVGGDLLNITLVSRDPILQMRPRLYEANPETLGMDISDLLNKVDINFRAGEIQSLDLDARTVSLESGEAITWDALVVATGSVMRRPRISGANDVWSIDNQAEAIEFDRRLAEIAGQSSSPCMIVVGAGFTGIELALELPSRLAAHGHDLAAQPPRIILLDRATEVGPRLGAGPRPVIEDALRTGSVELMLGMDIKTMTPTSVTLANGTVLQADAVILNTGLEAAPFTAQIPGDRDGAGRIIADRYLAAPSTPGIFVTGDSAAADTGDGRITAMSCQHALQTGRFAGENAARFLLGEDLIAYEQLRYVTCLDLGDAGAVFTTGWDRKVELTGSEAKARKQMINRQIIYPPAEATREEILAQSHINPEKRSSG